MDRNIPDVRNIFGGSNADKCARAKPELRSYEYSPRSRRKHEDYENYNSRGTTSYNTNTNEVRCPNHNRRTSRHRTTISDDLIEPVKQNKKSDESRKNSKNKDASHYSNRTLTERDIRHLERTLSMKKTIRKQISRNLAQAFVDDPDLVLKDNAVSVPTAKAVNKISPDNNMFTLTRAKVSKSEQNVLDLLKDNEPDSGHCSAADNPNSSDDDTQEQTKHRHVVKPPEKSISNSRFVGENASKPDQLSNDVGKFSFWKMFSTKNKGRR